MSEERVERNTSTMSHEDQSLMSAPYPVHSDPQKRREARGGVPRGPRRRPDGLVTHRAAVSHGKIIQYAETTSSFHTYRQLQEL
jgi:hypothetical protein